MPDVSPEGLNDIDWTREVCRIFAEGINLILWNEAVKFDARYATDKRRGDDVTNVLVAISDQHDGKILTDFVLNHRWTNHSSFKLVHVIEPLADDIYPESVRDSKCKMMAAKILNACESQIEKFVPHSNVEQSIRFGIPAKEIADAAEAFNADLIIIGCALMPSKRKNRSVTISSALDDLQSTVIVVCFPLVAKHRADFRLSNNG